MTNTISSSHCNCMNTNCFGFISPSFHCSCPNGLIKKNYCNYPYRQKQPWTDFEMLKIGYQVGSGDKSIEYMAWEF